MKSIYSKFLLKTEHDINSRKRNFFEAQYYGKLGIGTPPKEFRILFDSGSSDIWIPSKNCSNFGVPCTGKNLYNYSESTTYSPDNNISFNNFYGAGLIIGVLVKDDFYVSGLEVEQQVFAKANQVDAFEYLINGFDGIVGMGFPSLAVTQNFTPLMFSLKSQGKIKNNVWSYYFNGDFKNPNGTGSRIIIGGTSKAYYKGDFNYHKVLFSDSIGYWILGEGVLDLGGRNNSGKVQNFMVDTGNPDAIDYDSRLNITAPNLNSDCSNYKELPVIKVIIGEVEYELERKFYVFKIKNNNSLLCTLMTLNNTFPVVENNISVFLGDGFMTKYYTSFDFDKKVIGFALSK